MLFVTAAANLRAATFSIPTGSYYDTKGIAGNIIPAISSTNAIVAGLQVTLPLPGYRIPGSSPHRTITYTGDTGHASSQGKRSFHKRQSPHGILSEKSEPSGSLFATDEFGPSEQFLLRLQYGPTDSQSKSWLMPFA